MTNKIIKNKTVIPPKARLEKFTCPHCGAISAQLWGAMLAGDNISKVANVSALTAGCLRGSSLWREIIGSNGHWIISCCENCENICVWKDEKMIYPDVIAVDKPNEDLPDDIKNDYLEAASILNKSPRGAAALLRLCVQKLCKYLGKKGKNLNDDIGELVKDGLSDKVIKAMDVLRVTGDNAVHPGELDITDDTETATRLFELINYIADKTITDPMEIDSIYEKMPQSAKDAVEKRNNRK